jgi:hypothetical protein
MAAATSGPEDDGQEAAADAVGPEDVAADAAGDGDAGAEGPEDVTKRKFREALDRKRRQQAELNAGRAGKDAGKVHGTHGPAMSRRSFRRKSGG